MVPNPPLIPILAGERCIGHVIDRGRGGFEAFDRNDKSLGVFMNASAAVEALIAAASKPPGSAA